VGRESPFFSSFPLGDAFALTSGVFEMPSFFNKFGKDKQPKARLKSSSTGALFKDYSDAAADKVHAFDGQHQAFNERLVDGNQDEGFKA